jgi:hypothetical protein
LVAQKTGKNGNPDRTQMLRTPVLYDRITDKAEDIKRWIIFKLYQQISEYNID